MLRFLKSKTRNIVWRLSEIGQSSRRCRRRTPLKLELRSTGGGNRRFALVNCSKAIGDSTVSVRANHSIHFQSFVWRRNEYTSKRKHVAATATWTEYFGALWSTGERTGRKWSSNSFKWKTIQRWVPLSVFIKKKYNMLHTLHGLPRRRTAATRPIIVWLDGCKSARVPDRSLLSRLSVIGVIRPPRKRARLSRCDKVLPQITKISCYL